MSAATEETMQDPSNTIAIVPSDITSLVGVCTKGIYVGGAGDLVVKFVGDAAAVTLFGVTPGTKIRGNVSRVMAATTATKLVGFYGPNP